MCNNLLYQTLYLVDELNDVSNLLSNLQGISFIFLIFLIYNCIFKILK